jgi:hypothetical protein
MFNPDVIIKENVEKVYFSNFYLYYLNGTYYPIHFLIYTTISDNTNINLFYYNKFVMSITNDTEMDISLNSIFGNDWNNIFNDVNDISILNSKYFITQTLFNVGIFLNSEYGIIRYIPYEFTKKFFDVLFNKLNVKHDGLFHMYSGSKERNLVLENIYSGNRYYSVYKDYSAGFKDGMPIAITNNGIQKILDDRKEIEWSTLKNVECLNDLFSLNSNANYFNDIIFDIVKSGKYLTNPILLVNG